jgi:hypothetical protein
MDLVDISRENTENTKTFGRAISPWVRLPLLGSLTQTS